MSGKFTAKTIKNWIAIIAIILSMGVTWGYTKANIDNIQQDLIELEEKVVPRQEMYEVIKRIDQSTVRLETAVSDLDKKIDKNLEK